MKHMMTSIADWRYGIDRLLRWSGLYSLFCKLTAKAKGHRIVFYAGSGTDAPGLRASEIWGSIHELALSMC